MTMAPWMLGDPNTQPYNFGDALRQFGGAYDMFENINRPVREEQAMGEIFAANPDFAQKLYGAKNDQALLGIQRQRLAQEQQELLLKRQRAQQLGFPTDAPSAIQEYLFFSNLPDEDKQKYLNVKRANQVVNLGGTQAVVSPTGDITQQYTVTPKITDTPSYQAAQTAAQEQAKLQQQLQLEPEITGANKAASIQAEQQGELNKKSTGAANTIDLVAEAEKILPQATSGAIDRLGNVANSQLGVSTERSQADRQLQVISAALTGNVPRFEGPQGVLDVELYKQAAGDIANPSIPVGDRQAALKTIKTLQAKYAGNKASKPAALTVKPSEGMMIRNPTTGAVKFWRNGQWVDE